MAQVGPTTLVPLETPLFDLIFKYSKTCDQFLEALPGCGPLPLTLSESVKHSLTFSIAFTRQAYDVLTSLSTEFPTVPIELNDRLISGMMYTDLVSSMEREVEVLETKLKSQKMVLATRQLCADPSSLGLQRQNSQSIEEQEAAMLQGLQRELEAQDKKYRSLYDRCRFNEVCLQLVEWLASLTPGPITCGHIEKGIALPLFNEIIDDIIRLSNEPATTKQYQTANPNHAPLGTSIFDVLPPLDKIRQRLTFAEVDAIRARQGVDTEAYESLKAGEVPIVGAFGEIRSEAMLKLVQHLKDLNQQFEEDPSKLESDEYKSLEEAKQDALLEIIELTEQWKSMSSQMAAKELQLRTMYHVYSNFREMSDKSGRTFQSHFEEENAKLEAEVRRNEAVLEKRALNFELLLAEVELLRRIEPMPMHLTTDLVEDGEPEKLAKDAAASEYPNPTSRFKLLSTSARKSDAVGRSCMSLFGNMMMHANSVTNRPKTPDSGSDKEVFYRLAERGKFGEVVAAIGVMHAAQRRISERMEKIRKLLVPHGSTLTAAQLEAQLNPPPSSGSAYRTPSLHHHDMDDGRSSTAAGELGALLQGSPFLTVPSAEETRRSKSPTAVPAFATTPTKQRLDAAEEEPQGPTADEIQAAGTSEEQSPATISAAQRHAKRRAEAESEATHRSVRLFGPDQPPMSVFQAHILLSNCRVMQYPGVAVYLRPPPRAIDVAQAQLSGDRSSSPPTSSQFTAAQLTLSHDLGRWHVMPKKNTQGKDSPREGYREVIIWLHTVKLLTDGGRVVLSGQEGRVLRVHIASDIISFDEDDVHDGAGSTTGSVFSTGMAGATDVRLPIPPIMAETATTVLELLFPSTESYNEWAAVMETLIEHRGDMKHFEKYLTAANELDSSTPGRRGPSSTAPNRAQGLHSSAGMSPPSASYNTPQRKESSLRVQPSSSSISARTGEPRDGRAQQQQQQPSQGSRPPPPKHVPSRQSSMAQSDLQTSPSRRFSSPRADTAAAGGSGRPSPPRSSPSSSAMKRQPTQYEEVPSPPRQAQRPAATSASGSGGQGPVPMVRNDSAALGQSPSIGAIRKPSTRPSPKRAGSATQ